MPHLVEVFDMENHDDLTLTKEPLSVLPHTVASSNGTLHAYHDEKSIHIFAW